MMNELKVKELLGTEVDQKAICTMLVNTIVIDIAYEEGFSMGMQKLNTLSIIQHSNDELRTLIDNIDVSQSPHKVALLNTLLNSYLEFQKSYSESEWSVLQKQTIELVRFDYKEEQDAKQEMLKHTWSEFVFCTTTKSSIFDWDKLMVEVTREFNKLGITLYELSVKNRSGAVYYYLFNPTVDKHSDCRDFVLYDILLDVYIKEFGQNISESLLTKIWNRKKLEFKAIFVEPEGAKLREQLWNELFSTCVCDRDLIED